MGPITNAIVGGFGTLGQGVGQGVEGIRTDMDYKALAKEAQELFRQGASPEQAAQLLGQKYPGLMGGAGGAPGAPRPPQVPLTQPNVVGRTVGPSSPMGSLGAQPQYAPQPAPQYSPTPDNPSGTPPIAPLFRDAAAPEMRQSSPGPQAMLSQPPPATQPPSQPPPAPAAQAAGPSPMGRFVGAITPRNMPLAALLLQQRQQQMGQQVELAKAQATGDLRASIESMKEQGRDTRSQRSVGARLDIANMNDETKRELGVLVNDTRVMGLLMQVRTELAKLEQRKVRDQNMDENAKARISQRADLLRAAGSAYAAAKKAAAETQDPEDIAEASRWERVLQTAMEEGPFEMNIQITPGETRKETVPGFFGDTTKTTRTPPQAKVKPRQGAAPKTKGDKRADDLGL